MQASVTVDVQASPERLWAVLSDPEAWPAWTASVTSVRRLDAGPLRPGSRVLIRQPRLPPALWTVSDLVEGERFTWTAAGPGVRTRASHSVTPSGRGSRVTLAVEPDGAVGRLVARLTTGLTQRYLQLEAAGLRERSERPTD